MVIRLDVSLTNCSGIINRMYGKTNALGHQNPFLINQNLENSNIKEYKL